MGWWLARVLGGPVRRLERGKVVLLLAQKPAAAR